MNLNSYDRMAIKNAAKACSHFLAKKQTLVAKQEELQKQIDELNKTIAEYGEAVVNKTGYQPLELVEKVGGTWVFKYPEIIPTKAETLPDPPAEVIIEPVDEPAREEEPVSHYDDDVENTGTFDAEPAEEVLEKEIEEKEEKEEEFVDPFKF